MSDDGLRQAQQKMAAAGVSTSAIDVFSHYYRELESGATGLIHEDDITPLEQPPQLADVHVEPDVARQALSATVIIKLNGGLGTSMGMDMAKSLLPVRAGRTFLDLIAEQILAARAAHGIRLPLLLMNSFRTHQDSLDALARYPWLPVGDLPLGFTQSMEPKLRTDDLTPISWPQDPSLEWCPPGHGDLYTALMSSGALQALLDEGFHYASISNSDNLGASPDPVLAGWFAQTGAPYAAEVAPRTAADRKGGHLALRISDGQLILRDIAQVAAEDLPAFSDERRHPYFHTNNLWVDLRALHALLVERNAVLGLPLIRNVKTVDPADPASPQVYQIETAMGAAIEVFPGARAIAVSRRRFVPVKTTSDLLVLRSDVYRVNHDATLSLTVRQAPLVDLDPRFYQTIADFDQRFPDGAPSLRKATSLTVRGDWTFGRDVSVHGAAVLADQGAPRVLAPGASV